MAGSSLCRSCCTHAQRPLCVKCNMRRSHYWKSLGCSVKATAANTNRPCAICGSERHLRTYFYSTVCDRLTSGDCGFGCRRRISVAFLLSTKRSSSSGKGQAGQTQSHQRIQYALRNAVSAPLPATVAARHAGDQRVSQTTGLPRRGERHNLLVVTRARCQPHLFLGAC